MDRNILKKKKIVFLHFLVFSDHKDQPLLYLPAPAVQKKKPKAFDLFRKSFKKAKAEPFPTSGHNNHRELSTSTSNHNKSQIRQ